MCVCVKLGLCVGHPSLNLYAKVNLTMYVSGIYIYIYIRVCVCVCVCVCIYIFKYTTHIYKHTHTYVIMS